MTARAAVRLALAVAACLLIATLLWRADASAHRSSAPVRLALVLPDDLPADNAHVHAWLDAAAETGFPMRIVRASELLRPGHPHHDAALVLPDTVHRVMNDALVAAIEDRVREGVRLMLVHDAGVHGVDGRYLPRRSRLSELAGVDYALYDRLGAGTVRSEVVEVETAALPLLQLPPGKLMQRPAEGAAPQAPGRLAVASYHYGLQRYPVYVTRGSYGGQRLMHADADVLVAGVRRAGAGVVLFANLPLAELKLRTDGLLLHGLLRFFAQDVVGLPQLSPVPHARGALVLNLHIDSAAALAAMDLLPDTGVLDHGPFSVHLAAGAGSGTPGDRLGTDLARNEPLRAWVRRLVERGDEIGSHAGWSHGAGGQDAGRRQTLPATAPVERSVQAVATVSGRPVREYSAPLGDHPAWLTAWLRDRGVLGYYFTGDIGMAPTRTYQGGVRGPAGIWSFPVLSSGMQAGFEEAHAAGVSQHDMASWLKAVSDYCTDTRTVRLLYLHPAGLAHYPDAFRSWIAHSAALVRAGSLRWTTMAAYAAFANERLRTRWDIEGDASALRLTASHPSTLEGLGWLLPAHRYERPRVTAGSARVDADGPYWRVVAAAGTALEVVLPLRPAALVASSNASFAGPP